MAVEGSPQSLLVEMVTNETDTTTEDKETVQRANLNVFVCLFPSECSTVPKEINEADCDTPIDVENELYIIIRLHTGLVARAGRTVSFFAVVTVSTARA
jgi:starvation-inducible outer membrane lipoprotein